jgi:hypothetical protein
MAARMRAMASGEDRRDGLEGSQSAIRAGADVDVVDPAEQVGPAQAWPGCGRGFLPARPGTGGGSVPVGPVVATGRATRGCGRSGHHERAQLRVGREDTVEAD